MRIPDRIKILDQIIKITWNDRYCTKEGVLGQSNLSFNEIMLCHKYDGREIPQEKINQTFFHELSHFIMYIMRREKLVHDETFVDNLGTVLCNIMLNNDFKGEKENEGKIKAKRKTGTR